MSSLAVVVVVVGACIGVVTSVLTRTLEPATKKAPVERAHAEPAHAARPPTVREPDHSPEVAETVVRRRVVRADGHPVEPTRWWERARSAAALTAVSIALGVVAATIVGVAMVALFTLLRGAVG